MANRTPLIIQAGQVKQMQAGDFVDPAFLSGNSSIIVWGAIGNQVGTKYLWVGAAASDPNEIKMSIPRSSTVKNLRIRARIAPGGIATYTATIRKNGVDTALTVTLTGVQTLNVDAVNSIAFAVGDDISVKGVASGGANSISDIQVSAELA